MLKNGNGNGNIFDGNRVGGMAIGQIVRPLKQSKRPQGL